MAREKITAIRELCEMMATPEWFIGLWPPNKNFWEKTRRYISVLIRKAYEQRGG